MVTAVVKMILPMLAVSVVLAGGPWRVFLAAILVHELGHCLGARLTGIPLRRFCAGAGGFSLDFAMEMVSYRRELIVLLSGSGLGLLSLLLFPDPVYRTCALCLNLANLLPLPGLDGGRILYCMLCQRTQEYRAENICRRLGLAAALLLWMGGMWIVLRVGPNPVWMLCGMAALVQFRRKN
ncbi:MAG: hypothetical protein IKY52_11525 [Clostridia bacterium]|nr:hypothetical protein [Clostridia bacterium]